MTLRLACLKGGWTLTRTIEDRLAGRTGRFDGKARFSTHPRGLIYRESGVLRLPDAPPMQASRSYVFAETADGVAVLFEDGRPFHAFSFAPGGARAHHDCAPDRYLVQYDFSRWPVWAADWQAQGPRKDYRLLSTYTRDADPGVA